MIKETRLSIVESNFEFTKTDTGCGFMTIIRLVQMTFNQARIIWGSLSIIKKIILILSLIFPLPWFFLIKPLGYLIRSTRKYQGSLSVEYQNDKATRAKFSNIRKNSKFQVLGIPVFYYNQTKFNPKERKMLIKKFGQKIEKDLHETIKAT